MSNHFFMFDSAADDKMLLLDPGTGYRLGNLLGELAFALLVVAFIAILFA